MKKLPSPDENPTTHPLPNIISRIERLNQEAKDTRDAIKDVYSEARSKGYNAQVLRALIKKRAVDQGKLKEFQELFDLYEHSIQLSLPLGD